MYWSEINIPSLPKGAPFPCYVALLTCTLSMNASSLRLVLIWHELPTLRQSSRYNGEYTGGGNSRRASLVHCVHRSVLLVAPSNQSGLDFVQSSITVSLVSNKAWHSYNFLSLWLTKGTFQSCTKQLDFPPSLRFLIEQQPRKLHR